MPFPISPAEIAKTEVKSGFIFPIGMKTRLVKDNGGEIELAGECWQLVPFLDATDRKRLARTCNDIIRETASWRDSEGFPKDGFVIAENGTGNCLFILPDKEGSRHLGEIIYFWNHESHDYRVIADSLHLL